MSIEEGIGIKHTNSWHQSYKLITKIIHDNGLHSDNPLIYLNFGRDYYGKRKHVLNRKVEHISDKIRMNQLFDKYKIPHPKTYYYPFRDLPDCGDSCVIKQRYGRGKGRGVVFLNFNEIHRKALHNNMYVQDYIPFEKEYRVVNFIGNFRCREKIGNSKIKNSDTCRYRNHRDSPLERFAKQVCYKFKIDFAGLDIGIYKKKMMMIEINSACGLNENSAHTLYHFLREYYESVR